MGQKQEDTSEQEKKLTLEQKVKKISKFVEKYNPLDNSIEIDDDTEIDWKIKPKKDLDSTKFDIEISKELFKDNIEISVEIDGEMSVIKGITEDNLTISPEIKGSHKIKTKNTKDGSLEWKIGTEFSKGDDINSVLDKTNFSLQFNKDLTNSDVSIFINSKGKGSLLNSPPGSGNIETTVGFKMKLK